MEQCSLALACRNFEFFTQSDDDDTEIQQFEKYDKVTCRSPGPLGPPMMIDPNGEGQKLRQKLTSTQKKAYALRAIEEKQETRGFVLPAINRIEPGIPDPLQVLSPRIAL